MSYSPNAFDSYPVYSGSDLGLRYHPDHSWFKIWAPTAEAVRLHFYDRPLRSKPVRTLDMQATESGTWSLRIQMDLLGMYYAFQTKIAGSWMLPVPDPYAHAVGTNGQRAQVVDLAATHPPNWENDVRPPLQQLTDAIIYELHIRDISTHPGSGIRRKATFLGLAEKGTRGAKGQTTGLDHLVELGITHVHLLPVFDFHTVDESRPELSQYNWGYDPLNYNVPEGSYSSDPADGAIRIREFKQLVQQLHEQGIRVVMDVVYNHTGLTAKSHFNQLVPGYYYRQDAHGGFSNASACDNETASERAMVRKFIIDSVLFWIREYHIDGFRFDLMAIHDIDTMNQLSEAVQAEDPTILLYGEGWAAGSSPLPDDQMAFKRHMPRLQRIAAFSDDLRDGIKGGVFHADERGFASGQTGMKERIKFGIVASTSHPQINYAEVPYSSGPWAKAPHQTINYVSAHDNLTLWDKLQVSVPEANEQERIRMHRLSGAIVLTSQGIPFLHAGVEMLRSKQGNDNTYKSPDHINQIDWSRKIRYQQVYDYFRGLIQLRKAHPAFRLQSSAQVRKHLHFLEPTAPGLIAYQLTDHAGGDAWRTILVVFNGRREYMSVDIPGGYWTVVVDAEQVQLEGMGSFETDRLIVPGSSAIVLHR